MRLIELLENSRLIKTPAFRRWFAGSKVVNQAGDPLIVYHGTNQTIDRFRAARRGLSTKHSTAFRGFWFTDSHVVAAEYAQLAGERVRPGIDEFERRQSELRQRVEQLERIAQRTGRNEDWDKATAAMEEWDNLEIDSMREDPSVGQNIVPVYLRMVTPLVLDAEGRWFIDVGGYHVMGDAIDAANRNGQDGLIIHRLADSSSATVATHYVVFSARQIKSAISG